MMLLKDRDDIRVTVATLLQLLIELMKPRPDISEALVQYVATSEI